ncbi:MAG: NAD(P)-dependent alcohol dehydrogenase, partial [Alphaproteobacteria bacterium]|nr:NAD(P)-dependent alcohol dehydrogenase [Alphaproteobacteria bacterium]
MRSYLLPAPGSIDALKIVDLPQPRAKRGQLVIRVHACSLNYRDLSIVLGTYRMGSKPELIPLSDGAGEVVDVGEGVTKFKTGDRVAGNFFQAWQGGEGGANAPASALGGAIDGMLADYVALEEGGAVHVPAHLSYEEAASLPCAAVTAWHALRVHGDLIPGRTV